MSKLSNSIKAKDGEVRANKILIDLTMDAVNKALADGDLYLSGPLSSVVENLFSDANKLADELRDLKAHYLEEEGHEWGAEEGFRVGL